jgi:hypothetical protein
MPVNVADLLSEADFFNLVAFLVQQRGIGEKR